MKLEDLPSVEDGKDAYVEVVYLDKVDVPFLRWLRISRRTQGYLHPAMTGGIPVKLLISGERAPGGGYIRPFYVPLADVKRIQKLEERG